MFKNLNSPRLDEIVSPHVAILLLRIGAACLVMTHGIPKLMRILEGNYEFGDPLGIGPALSLFLVTFAEAICAFFVLVGLWTRVALIPLIINMLVIVFIAHADDPFGNKEKGAFFLVTWIVLFLTGAGKYSLDKFFNRKSRRYRP